MKRFITIISLLIAASAIAQPLDSLKRASLDAKLEEYVAAIEAAGSDVQKEEVDFLIESVSDSLVRQHVAMKLYDHYLSSKVMGAEAVAIHILDGWFFNGKVRMPDDIALINARVFAEFNRQSLIGNQAPQLMVEDMTGNQLNLYGSPSARYSILYFYDSGCAKCKVETILLRGLLEDEEYPVNLYAFYAGDDREAWEKYVDERFEFSSSDVNVVHVWDPQVESDFQRKYGVLQTPRMYLIRPDGTIIGRGLDAHALAQMLAMIFAERKLDYGSAESMELFSNIFAGGNPSAEEVKNLADIIADSTLEKGDTVMFRQLTGDMMYYLASERGSGYKEGLGYLLDEYILNPELKAWRSPDDSLKVIGYARMVDELLSKSAVGSRIADIKVPCELLYNGKEVHKNISLRKLGGKDNIIIFHTEGCHVCAAEIAAARNITAKGSKTKVYLVNIDEILMQSPSLAGRLFDTFDLASLPFILTTDKKGIILNKYITLQN